MGEDLGNANIKAAVLLVLVVTFTVFVLQNTETVEITFFFWRVSVSRVLLLLGSGFVGGLGGFFVGWSVFTRKPRAASRKPSDAGPS